jgi:hypothetical protein
MPRSELPSCELGPSGAVERPVLLATPRDQIARIDGNHLICVQPISTFIWRSPMLPAERPPNAQRSAARRSSPRRLQRRVRLLGLPVISGTAGYVELPIAVIHDNCASFNNVELLGEPRLDDDGKKFAVDVTYSSRIGS